jgi:uncharacterized protein (DUF3084 family)
MEIDSKPEVMDKLDRRMIQLKIEREAVRKERDEASKKRMQLIEEELRKLEREYNDLDEVWKAEKAQVQGSAHIKEEIDRLKLELAGLKRESKWEQVAEIEYGRCASSRRNCWLPRNPRMVLASTTSYCVPKSVPRRSPRWFPAPPVFQCRK